MKEQYQTHLFNQKDFSILNKTQINNRFVHYISGTKMVLFRFKHNHHRVFKSLLLEIKYEIN